MVLFLITIIVNIVGPRDRAAVDREVEGRLMAATAPGPVIDLEDRETWRRTKSNIAVGLMVAALVLVAIPLVLVLYTVIKRGYSVISWDFLTGLDRPADRAEGGDGARRGRHDPDHGRRPR